MHPILIAMAILATPNFPGVIQSDLNLAGPPRCSVCHATDSGGTGTAVQPFAVYLRSRGLVAYDEPSLRNALLADAGEHHSSSASGIADTDALKAGQNPNGEVATGASAPDAPAYGCSSAGPEDLLAIAALAAWLYARRWRRYRKIPDGSHFQS